MHVRDIIQNQERLCTSGQLEHNKRNFISTSNHVFFVYHINTKALYWQEKSPLLMNENKRIDNPWIRVVKCVDALKMKTCLEWLQKQTVGLISNIKKFTVIELVLTDRRNPSGSRTVANLPTFDFRLHQNRRQVASFLYAQLLCTGTWVPDKSFKKNCFNYGSVTKNWCIKDIYFLWGFYCRKDATWTQITTAAPVRLKDN